MFGRKNTMAKSPQAFSLPDQAKRSLKALLKKGTHATRKLTRVRILLKLDQGLGPSQIARDLGVHPNTVCTVRNRANAQGWQAAIEEQRRTGRPAEVSGTARAQVTALACSDPPKGRHRWTLRLLADKAVEHGFVESISHETVREVLKKTSSNLT